jgi:hypothetical protein
MPASSHAQLENANARRPANFTMSNRRDFR